MTGSRRLALLRKGWRPLLVALASLSLVLVACSSADPPGASAAPFVGAVHLDPDHGPAGTQVHVTGTGLPASADLQLAWGTWDGRWLLDGDLNENYEGREYTPRRQTLTSVQTDASGNLEATFTAPRDFGFAHDVLLLSGGTVVNKALFNLDMQVSISPTSGPVGTPITISVDGIGIESLENSRTVLYDNGYAGWMSAVTTHGSATAVIPATGSPGTHVIVIGRGAFTFPYLNPAQSPRKDIPVFTKTFTVTDGTPVMPPSLAEQNPSPANAAAGSAGSGATLTTDLGAGPVGTDIEVNGSGLPAGATVSLGWHRIVGNRVGGNGWDEQRVEVAKVTVGSDGTLTYAMSVPGDVGGKHRLEVSQGDKELAETWFTVTPAAFPLDVSAGPAGTPFTIHLTGVGWTETANIYTVVYDNRYIGYVCGFNSQGDVIVPMQAAGTPGWHFIDLYPAIYKGNETAHVQNFRIPQLTYAQDHPGEVLPAFHFAFHVTG